MSTTSGIEPDAEKQKHDKTNTFRAHPRRAEDFSSPVHRCDECFAMDARQQIPATLEEADDVELDIVPWSIKNKHRFRVNSMKIRFIIEEKTESVPVTVIKSATQREAAPLPANGSILHWKQRVHATERVLSHYRI